ncbi:kinase-like protein [Suillus decipiens]|nr:kinase-like protein [Suillus decipiens]
MQQETDTQPDSDDAVPLDRVDGLLAADQRGFSTGTLKPSPLATPEVAPSRTQAITSVLIPNLTSLITRYSPDPISGGTYGNIYKCKYHGPEGDEDVAVKAIRPQYFNADTFRRELGIWKRLQHSNILKFMGTTEGFGPSVALVAPWMTNGTLTSFLDKNNETLKLGGRMLLLRDIAAGLEYLHTFSLANDGHTNLNPVVHGDLTGNNVLVDGDRRAYLADFGLSGTLNKLTGMTYLARMTCHPGAVRWAAPELLSGEEPTSAATTQSDMYSFGSIMLQVLTGNVPWCHLTHDFRISYQVVIEGKIHPRPHNVDVTDRHWNFMTRCWSMSRPNRPLVKEAVQFVDSTLHPSTSTKTPTSSIPSDERYSMSPQTSTLSISSDERHPNIARNDYLHTGARLTEPQDIDSPFDLLWDYSLNYPGVLLPNSFSTYTGNALVISNDEILDQIIQDVFGPDLPTKKPRVRCSACNVIFYKENLRRHVLEVHNRAKHTCLRCGKSSNRKSHVRDHICRSCSRYRSQI